MLCNIASFCFKVQWNEKSHFSTDYKKKTFKTSRINCSDPSTWTVSMGKDKVWTVHLHQSTQSADPSKCPGKEGKSLLHLRTQIWDIIRLHGLTNPLTSRHEVVTKDGQAEVPCQRGQGGLDAWEFLGEARGFCSKVAESTKTKDAMGMVAKYVVPAWEQVVGFN